MSAISLPTIQRELGEHRLKHVKPSDDLAFDALASRYNFENTSDRSRVFANLIIKECQSRQGPVRVLDVGCGKGIELNVDLQWDVRQRAGDYWGLEPDRSIKPVPGLFDHWLTHTMEDAPLPEGYFDVAYSFMVMEHLADPASFMRAVQRCLRPGGVYLFATPNGRHYFTRIAAAMRAIRMEERVLRLARQKAEVDAYHYPVRYAFNSERQIKACTASVGCQPPKFAYVEEQGPIRYFPKPTRFVYHALRFKRKVWRDPRALVTMIGRVQRP